MSPENLLLGVSLGMGMWLLGDSLLLRRRDHPDSLATPRSVRNKRSPPSVFGLRALLEEAGLDTVDARVVLALGLACGVVCGFLVVALIPIPTLGIIAAVVVPLLGYAYLSRVKAHRSSRLRRAWPGVIDHLRSGVRSGHDVAGALMALPDTLPRDISGPREAFDRDISRGMATDDALADLGRRLADPVADRIVEVLRMAHEVGGVNLPGVLLELQKSVRVDIAVREDAHAQQSWIRSASVLAVSAPWVVLVLIGTRQATLSAYQSAEGAGILIIGAVVSLVAFGLMKKIGSLSVQRRWLG